MRCESVRASILKGASLSSEQKMDSRLRRYRGKSVVNHDRGQTMQERSLFKLLSCSLCLMPGASLVDAAGDQIKVASGKEHQAAHPDRLTIIYTRNIVKIGSWLPEYCHLCLS